MTNLVDDIQCSKRLGFKQTGMKEVSKPIRKWIWNMFQPTRMSFLEILISKKYSRVILEQLLWISTVSTFSSKLQIQIKKLALMDLVRHRVSKILIQFCRFQKPREGRYKTKRQMKRKYTGKSKTLLKSLHRRMVLRLSHGCSKWQQRKRSPKVA